MKYGMCENDGERVSLLMSYGYPKAKAEEIVKAGKFEDTLESDYHSMVEDPIGALEERLHYGYDSRRVAK